MDLPEEAKAGSICPGLKSEFSFSYFCCFIQGLLYDAEHDLLAISVHKHYISPVSRPADMVNPLTGILELQSNGSLCSNAVIGALAVDGWAVTFGTAMRCLGGLRSCRVPSLLYQM